MATFEVCLTDDIGVRIGVLSDFIGLDYTLVENDISTAVIVVPGSNYGRADFRRDYRLEIYRNGKLEGDKPFFIREVTRSLAGDGRTFFSLGAVCANDLLRRRHIAYYSGSSEATLTDFRDDIMRSYVRYNLGANATSGNRDITPDDITGYFTVEEDTGDIGSTTVSASRKNLLTTLQSIANDSWQGGSYIAFDTIYGTGRTLTFKVYNNGQRGLNRSVGNDVTIFSPDLGNLANVERGWNWLEEITAVIGAGRNAGAAREIVTATSSRKNASVFNYIEGMVDGRNLEVGGAALAVEVQQALKAAEPREYLTGQIIETPVCKRGVHWDWGDLARASFEGEVMTIRIPVLHVHVSGGGYEESRAALRVEL